MTGTLKLVVALGPEGKSVANGTEGGKTKVCMCSESSELCGVAKSPYLRDRRRGDGECNSPRD